LIFRATFLNGEMPNRNQLYWRGAVLDKSSGLNWDRSKSESRRGDSSFTVQNPDLEIYQEPGSERFLFSLENTQFIGFPSAGNRISMREGRTYELNEPLQTRERYLIQRSDKVLAQKENLDQYLEVSEEPSTEVQNLLKKFNNKSAGEAILGLRGYFQKEGFHYSLKPPPVAKLDDFLFKTKIGFCEHFAGATATLLRYLKIPARVVVGFQGGTKSFFDNFISVRGHDAHAWVEYYDRQSSRWRRLDPTAEVEPLRVTEGSDSYFQDGRSLMPSWMPGGWVRPYLRSRAFIDEVEANWTGFLLHFDLARQKELLAKFGMEETLFRALAVFLILSAGLILAVLYFFEAQRREPLTEDEKIYRQLIAVLRKWKIEKLPQEGPLTLLTKVQMIRPDRAAEVESILQPLILSRFGQEVLTEKTLVFLRQRLKWLRRFK
jgi:protein-glutamine gamma-glutamyltransferase